MRMIKTLLLLSMCIVLLTACGSKKGPGNAGALNIPENPGNLYRVIIVDESGAPVPGVRLQFCSEALCMVGETGEDGIALFENLEEGSYTVHIQKLPQGYAPDSSEYDVPETYGDLTITVKAAE